MDHTLAEYLFHQGTNFHAYTYLGCHAEKTDEGWCYTFRTWAPNAAAVSVIGDFTNAWQAVHPLVRVSEQGYGRDGSPLPTALTVRNISFLSQRQMGGRS